MKRPLLAVISLVLAGILGLCFFFPHEMVSPGNLIPAHTRLQEDCFACHAPFRGASAHRCMECHKLADIGVKTTTGVPIPRSSRLPPFHQALIDPDCMACHSDHSQPWLLPSVERISFDHALLRPSLRTHCENCHVPPADEMHRGQLPSCSRCHSDRAWMPSTYDHDRYFVLDRDHRVACITCHVGGNYHKYTCYGCHEHRRDRIVAEHREEGIRDVEDCVRCHKSPRGEPREGEREGRGHERDDD